MSSSSEGRSLHVLPLLAKPQQYAWGKLGSDSEVAKVLSAGGQSVDPSKPYAELWMGTHPTAPSSVLLPSSASSPVLLSEYLHAELPYLFKILSIRTALSIQAHPDIPLARRLHSTNPKEYKDANHKPEMATSITPFEAMCGFRPHQQISRYLHLVPELRQLVGDHIAVAYEQAVRTGDEADRKRELKSLFGALMTAKAEVYKPALHRLLQRLPISDPFAASSPVSSDDRPTSLDVFALVQRLQEQYPDDIGVLCPFLLNSFQAPPFVSLFLPANEPHAYISGDIVECMACSDNVVRAGLTPKFRDVENLINMLTYDAREPAYLKPEQASPGVQLFIPPIEEFELAVVRSTGGQVSVKETTSHGILLVWKGMGRLSAAGEGSREIKAGDVLLVPSGVAVEVQGSGGEELIAFKCSENDRMKNGKAEQKANV